MTRTAMDLMRFGFGKFKTKVPRRIGSSEGMFSGSGELEGFNRGQQKRQSQSQFTSECVL